MTMTKRILAHPAGNFIASALVAAALLASIIACLPRF
jgi:hypothetical protein